MTDTNADNPLADGPYWIAVREFAVSEIAVQRGHARCFRRLAELLRATPDGAFAMAHAAGFTAERVDLVKSAEQCEELADGTDAQTARAEAALQRDDRAEVAEMVGACMLGYMRGLAGRAPQLEGGR